MLKEKYENAKKFMEEHKSEIALIGCSIIGGAVFGGLLGARDRMRSMEKNIKTLGLLTDITLRNVNDLNKDLEALAHHNGLTIEDVWDIAFKLKYPDINVDKKLD